MSPSHATFDWYAVRRVKRSRLGYLRSRLSYRASILPSTTFITLYTRHSTLVTPYPRREKALAKPLLLMSHRRALNARYLKNDNQSLIHSLLSEHEDAHLEVLSQYSTD